MNEDTSSKNTPSKSFSYIDEEKLEAKNYMKSFTAPKPIKTNLKTKLFKSKIKKIQKEKRQETLLSEIQNIPDDNIIDDSIEYEDLSERDVTKIKEPETDHQNEVEDLDVTDDINFDDDDDFDMSTVDLDETDSKTENKESKITEAELISGWETMQDGTNINTEPYVPVNTDELPCIINEDKQQVCFF